MVIARKDKHSLPVFLERFGLSKSSYYYQETAMRREDKYDGVRRRISELVLVYKCGQKKLNNL
ncbi:hypothetical protein [Enterocloster clostridioformis]|uniref:Uncharacterized protein n=1 Tax=Enterocloster clostridioformis TaxID=1531 RepID=A0A1I0F973_9FIRM|nr:hypothetical protein [Enterocloster clostridioformis]SET54650.1 hypothetical protein SAMN05216521_101276 [Enterocloster clostridioformis]SEW19890.1 hypothetical protein SAMN05216528_10149 [Enterocloster clostridioformis]